MSEAIAVRGLTKSYNGKTVLRGLDLSVKTGSVFGLLGANGAGKAPQSNVYWEQNRLTAEKYFFLGGIREGSAGSCFRKLAFNFRRETISRRSGYRSYVRKLPACTGILLTGKSSAPALELEISSAAQ